AILDGEAHGPVVVDGYELENESFTQYVARNLQTEWILALLEHGERLEARNWLARWEGQKARSTKAAESSEKDDKAVVNLREILRNLAEDSPPDIFDLLVSGDEGPGGLVPGGLSSPAGRKVLVDYLTRSDYPALAAYVQTLPC